MNLPAIHSYEEFENLKKNREVFESAAHEIIARHHLPHESLVIYEGTNIVFAYGNYVIKIYPPIHKSHYINEALVMKHIHHKLSVNTPVIYHEGEIDHWPYIIMSKLEGTLLEGLWEKLDQANKIIIIRELGKLIREVHALQTTGLEAIDCHWPAFIHRQIDNCIKQHQETKLPEVLLKQLPKYLEAAEDILPKIKKTVLLTGEYTPMNFLVTQKSGVWHIHGLIDFGDCMLGLPEYDLLGPGVFLIQGDKVLLREFLMSYGYLPKDLTAKLSHQLMLLMLLHRYSNLNMQIRIEHWQNKLSNLKELENLVWGLE